ncbi:predicted protein [Chaetomium globosum CBS 148.51]|uniref:Uncharacterized protein n=1 Tax=Chaetomium globosum (strain ATCC 6205 / CBS 148.51 / DSM 1962 / NBRC 6347 / NRRL 1970) TaxID=306901 RepID=Q2HG91_CHAGB|nr:uncharacterized protein CHGG_00763 [Chaetomium globosum CBS 148.51]EAQ92528.1 predicted protein [Chaetomium globosum CBS 148.51]
MAGITSRSAASLPIGVGIGSVDVYSPAFSRRLTQGFIPNLLVRGEKGAGERSEVLSVEHKVILEEIVGRVTQPAAQNQNAMRKEPGQTPPV